MSKLKPYPIWVCRNCAYKASAYSPASRTPTFHEGKCNVCGRIRGVTEPRDYGYPKFEGHEER